MTNQKDSSVKTAKPAENPAKEDQNETPTEEKATDASITVVVHPLVLLSVVDHFNRMGKIGNQKRVVGVLLGKFPMNWRVMYFRSNILFPIKSGTGARQRILFYFH